MVRVTVTLFFFFNCRLVEQIRLPLSFYKKCITQAEYFMTKITASIYANQVLPCCDIRI